MQGLWELQREKCPPTLPLTMIAVRGVLASGAGSVSCSDILFWSSTQPADPMAKVAPSTKCVPAAVSTLGHSISEMPSHAIPGILTSRAFSRFLGLARPCCRCSSGMAWEGCSLKTLHCSSALAYLLIWKQRVHIEPPQDPGRTVLTLISACSLSLKCYFSVSFTTLISPTFNL